MFREILRRRFCRASTIRASKLVLQFLNPLDLPPLRALLRAHSLHLLPRLRASRAEPSLTFPALNRITQHSHTNEALVSVFVESVRGYHQLSHLKGTFDHLVWGQLLRISYNLPTLIEIFNGIQSM